MVHNFSPIQNHILSKLKNAKELRYRDMQPKDIPNDLYNYHLQFLVDKGFAVKNKVGYSLSSEGLKYVADPFSDKDNAITSLFKINVITIASRITNGNIEILNQHRKSNPSFGKIGVMGGVVFKGEPIEDASSRKFNQETGLTARFKTLGLERRFLYKNNELFSDVVFPITYSCDVSGILIAESDFGQNLWVTIDDAIKNESQEFDSIRSIVKVLIALRDGTLDSLPFFFEESTQTEPV